MSRPAGRKIPAFCFNLNRRSGDFFLFTSLRCKKEKHFDRTGKSDYDRNKFSNHSDSVGITAFAIFRLVVEQSGACGNCKIQCLTH